MGSISLVRVYDARSGHERYDEVAAVASGPDEPSVFLVDRVWPRGIAKDALPYDLWQKTVAPSTELRKWFGHDPAKFGGFAEKYRAELDANTEATAPLLAAARTRPVVLLYSAKDEEHNQAVVLGEWLGANA